MRRFALAGVATLTLLGGATLTALPAHAATTFVVSANGTNCQTSTPTPYTSINAAVTAASNGDIIVVCAGTYNESVSTAKVLDLRGAEYGVDARTRSGAETVVNGGINTAFTFSSAGSSINGFTISGVGDSNNVGVSLQASSITVNDNIFDHNIHGVTAVGTAETIEFNKFVGGANGNGIGFNGQANGEGSGSGSTVLNNSFSGDLSNAAISVVDTAALPAEGLLVSGSTADLSGTSTSTFLITVGTHNMGVTDNTISANGLSGPGIELAGANSAYVINGNTISHLGHVGIYLADNTNINVANGAGSIEQNVVLSNFIGLEFDSLALGSTAAVHQNVIFGNDGGTNGTSTSPAAGIATFGAGDIEAEDNFWGCNTGPGTGKCDVLIDRHATGGALVTSPWLLLSASVASASIAVGGTTTFSANFTHDSGGTTFTGRVANNLIVNFAFSKGTVTGAQGSTVSGVATTTLTGTTAGAGTATASFEQATASVPVTVTVTAALPALTIHGNSTLEGNSGTHALAFKVTLSKKSTKAVTVRFTTVNGTAVAGSDFVAKSGLLTIGKGKTTGSISIVIKGDKVKEANETFTVVLSTPTNATIAVGTATGTIRNDD